MITVSKTDGNEKQIHIFAKLQTGEQQKLQLEFPRNEKHFLFFCFYFLHLCRSSFSIQQFLFLFFVCGKNVIVKRLRIEIDLGIINVMAYSYKFKYMICMLEHSMRA